MQYFIFNKSNAGREKALDCRNTYTFCSLVDNTSGYASSSSSNCSDSDNSNFDDSDSLYDDPVNATESTTESTDTDSDGDRQIAIHCYCCSHPRS